MSEEQSTTEAGEAAEAVESAESTEPVEANDTDSGDVQVPLNEKASRKEEAIEKLRAALRAENNEPEPADPILDADNPEEPYKVNSDEAIRNAPDDIKKLYANMRADYTRKTQALAEERRQLRAFRRTSISRWQHRYVRRLSLYVRRWSSLTVAHNLSGSSQKILTSISQK